jgi:hypothetical protein
VGHRSRDTGKERHLRNDQLLEAPNLFFVALWCLDAAIHSHRTNPTDTICPRLKRHWIWNPAAWVVYFNPARIISSVLLGGALSLLVSLLVLGVAAIAILAVWLLLGRRDETPLRNPFTAYLGIVLFLSFLVALVSVKGLAASIAGAIADQPLDYCQQAVYEEAESVPELLQPVPAPRLEEVRPPSPGVPRRVGPGRLGGPVRGQAPQVTAPPPVPVRPQIGQIRSLCEGAGGRDRAASQAAQSGTALIVALGIMLFHARAGKRLLDEERHDA